MDDDDDTTYETPMFLCFNLNYIFIGVYWWTRQRIHNILIVVDRYPQPMADKTIPDLWAEFGIVYPPFIAGIDLPHQGAFDSFNPNLGMSLLLGDVTIGHWRHNQPT